MFIKQATQLNNILLRACKCVNTRYFQTNSFLSVAGDFAADGGMCQEKKHVLEISLGTCPTTRPPLVMATAYSSCSLVSSRAHLQRFINHWSPYGFINMMASNNAIKLLYNVAGTGTCHCGHPGNKRRGLNRRRTRLNAGSKIIYRK